jgi:hypothetical protein
MRILFDQNLPRALRNLLPGHDVRTAAEMGWSTLANGILVDAAERGGFEAIITADRSIRLQVNISSRRLAVIILSTNHWPALQRGAPAIQQALQQARPGSYQDVAVGRFRRGRSGPPPSPRMHLRLMAARTGKTASGARSDRCESGGAPFAAFGKSPALRPVSGGRLQWRRLAWPCGRQNRHYRDGPPSRAADTRFLLRPAMHAAEGQALHAKADDAPRCRAPAMRNNPQRPDRSCRRRSGLGGG